MKKWFFILITAMSFSMQLYGEKISGFIHG